MRARAVLLIFSMLLADAAASTGDRSLDFQNCIKYCEETGCTDWHQAHSTPPKGQNPQKHCSPVCPQTPRSTAGMLHALQPPMALKLWRWDCGADCRYLCMWQREESKGGAGGRAAAQVRQPAEKYFGKWPFTRVLGMQEAASVIFSLLNMAAQLRCLYCYVRLTCGASPWAAQIAAGRRGVAGAEPPGTQDRAAARACRWLWVVQFQLAASTWVFSALFHGRDTWLTERLDYYWAGALIAFNLLLSIVRVLRLTAPRPRLAVGAGIFGYYWVHVYHMQFTLFDYGLHLRCCIIAGVLQAALWVYWALAVAPDSHKGRGWLVAMLCGIHISMLFEILDFVPLGHILDAHACWHLATVPLAYVWYRFVVEDWVHGSGAGAEKQVH